MGEKMIDNNLIMIKLKERIKNNKVELLNILRKIERDNVVNTEIELSIQALEHNYKYSKRNNLVCSSYLPMNLPLYSLIVYVAIPRRNCERCFYRPASTTNAVLKELHELLKLDEFNINLVDLPRQEFFDKYVDKSDVVVFVGKTENAELIRNKLKKDTMFIYFGVGQNTIVVEEDADIELASKKIVEAVLFNYGQDCGKPNVILVNKNIFDILKEKIISEIDRTVADNRTTIKDLKNLKEVAELLVDENENICYGGDIDFFHKTLSPVVVSKDIQVKNNTYKEFYAPVFRLMAYESDLDLKNYFLSPSYKNENMNISLFGTNEYIQNLPASIILNNSIVSDVDNGYSEFGGYGKNVSFVEYKGIKIIKPLLINREIELFYNDEIFSSEMAKTSTQSGNLKRLLYYEVRKNMLDIFGNDLLFSFIFGSYAKGNQKQTSDVDIFGCIKHLSDVKLKRFVEWYLQFHYKYGIFPDFMYPGEIISEEKLDSIVKNSNSIEFRTYNSADVYDAIFYTQILMDKKDNLLGNTKLLDEYIKKTERYVSIWCRKIYELLIKEKMIISKRENSKCLIALRNNDLLFFSKKLQFDENTSSRYDDIINKIDDGFFKKTLKIK